MNFKHLRKFNFIYLTQNTLNGHSYVGFHATDNINDGYMGSGILLNKKIKEYGKDKFKVKILEHIEFKDWDKKEAQWIQKLNTLVPNGYNLSAGGDGGFLGEEAVRKSANSRIGKTRTQEQKDNISKSLLGKSHSIQANINVGLGLLGGSRTNDQKKNMSLGQAKRERIMKICPYCGKSVDFLNYGRWHGDRCHTISIDSSSRAALS